MTIKPVWFKFPTLVQYEDTSLSDKYLEAMALVSESNGVVGRYNARASNRVQSCNLSGGCPRQRLRSEKQRRRKNV
jgi:hypothetical protein